MSPPPVASLRIEPAEALAQSSLSAKDLSRHVSPTHEVGVDLGWTAFAGIVGCMGGALLFVPGATGWLIGAALAAFACVVALMCEGEKTAFTTGAGSLACLVATGIKVVSAGWPVVLAVAAVGLIVAAATLAVLRLARELGRRSESALRLRRLYAEVEAFNHAVEVAEVQQRLEALGAARPLSPELLDALRAARLELLRALAIDRVLREHRGVLQMRGAAHVSALFPVEAGQVTLEAAERGEALAVSLSAVAEARAVWERELAAVGND